MYVNNFELHDFIDNPNFDQFVNLIRGENEDSISNFGSNLINDFGSTLINDSFVDNQLLSCPTNPFDHQNIIDDNNVVDFYDPSSTTISSFSYFDGEVKGEGEGEGENDGGDSSTTTTTTTTTKPRVKTDRSKTLVSERRRRGRMKDKLYALRALVPNITKVYISQFQLD